MKFGNMKVGSRMYLGFSGTIVLMVIINVIGISSMANIQESLERIVRVNIVRTDQISEMATLTKEESINLRNILLVKDATKRQDEKKKIEDARAKYNGAFKKSEEMTAKDDTKGWEVITKIKGNQDTARELNNRVVDLALANRDSEANDLMLKEARPAVGKWLNSVDEFKKHQNERTQTVYDQASNAHATGRQFMFIFGAIAFLSAVLTAFFNTRSITGRLHKIIDGLIEGSDQVASSSAQVSSSSQSLAEGATEQAAGLEETSSSMEEMASMTRQNADNAHQAKTMMGEARQIVENVNTHMGEMAQAISEITKSSEETGKIIKTIDEIAFQTNLLALNAAVEAARAGEAGAGFAVVADEVRNLAMRAAEAAKNTSSLIENTIKSVKTGNELTQATQEAFKKNVEISSKIGKLVEEIAAASQEQAQGVEQVNKAVAEMDKVTQSTAANAEESASAAEEMNAQAEQMKVFVADLVALVGVANENGTMSAKGLAPHRNIKRMPAVVDDSSVHAMGNGGQKSSAVPLKKEKKAGGPVHQAKGTRPAQAIPLGDEDFKQF